MNGRTKYELEHSCREMFNTHKTRVMYLRGINPNATQGQVLLLLLQSLASPQSVVTHAQFFKQSGHRDSS